MRWKITGLAAVLAMLSSVGSAVPVMAEPAATSGTGPPGSEIIYYGSTPSGQYFQTMPMDATNPANVSVARPDLTLPQDSDAHGIVVPGRNGPRMAVCEIYVNPVGFDLTRRAIYAGIDQSCDSDIVEHWVRYRFDRAGVDGWQPYSPDRLTEAVAESPWTFLAEEACTPGAGQYNYVTNADGHANVNDGTQIHSPVVVNEPTPGNCGGVIP